MGHEGKRDKICTYCGNAFGSISVLNKHTKTVHLDEKDKCDKCGKGFSNHQRLLDHISYHHEGKKNYGCDVCGSFFPTNYSLKVHIKEVHFKSLDFACNVCGKAFVRKHKLTRHIKGVHEGKKGPEPTKVLD